jgi:hypothetical protein
MITDEVGAPDLGRLTGVLCVPAQLGTLAVGLAIR